jgi:hypothetical protein
MIGFMVGGCVPAYDPIFTTHVKSLSVPIDDSTKSYFIRNVNGEKPDNSLRQNARLKFIRKLFKRCGYIETSPTKAKLEIDIIFGITEPKKETGSTPIFGQTGVSSSTTYGSFSSYGTYNSTTYNTPTYGVVGSQSYSYDKYTRFLVVTGYSRANKELFESEAISSGTSGDLDRVLPMLTFNMLPYLGKNISKTAKNTITEKAPEYLDWLSFVEADSKRTVSTQTSEIPLKGKPSKASHTTPKTYDEKKKQLLNMYLKKELTKEEYFELRRELDRAQ